MRGVGWLDRTVRRSSSPEPGIDGPPVWIVLHDHGNIDLNETVFQVDDVPSPDDKITPAQLDAWLDDLQDAIEAGILAAGGDPADAPIVVVGAFCYSGGLIDFVNQQAELLFGYEAREMIGLPQRS